MSSIEYEKINSRVIRCEDEYLSKAYSAETFQNIFTNEEARYEISVSDAKIKTADGTYTSAVVFTYFGESHFVDVVVSHLLGTFVSDWH